jgi:serine/threonine protein kinase
MPYMAGGTLAEYMAKRGPLSLEEAQWYLQQIAAALDYAHKHGCVHCDVKPANILLDSDGQALLSDFGIAHVAQTGDTTQPATKTPEALMGTPDYISPEQALGQPLDGRSDIYSFGITLFYLLAKRLPFSADSTIALALLHIHEAPPSLALLRVDITPEIDRVIQKALAKGPDNRFQTAGEFSQAFTRAVEHAEGSNSSSSNGRHANQVKGVAVGNSQAPLLPLVRVRSVKADSSRLPRLVVLGLIVLLLLSAGAFGASVVASRITNVASKKSAPAPTATRIISRDLLMNHDYWPASNTYFYANDAYHIKNISKCCVALALYANHEFQNFRLKVTMREIRGSHDTADYYGVIFRASVDQSSYYVFEVDTTGSGQYVFWRYDNSQWKTIMAGFAPSLVTSKGASNTITVEGRNNVFTFFINGKPIGKSLTDSQKPALSRGEIGLYVEEQAEVAFSNLSVDDLG